MSERKTFIQQQWEASGGSDPLGRFTSFQEAVQVGFRNGESGYNRIKTPAVVICMDEGIRAADVEEKIHQKDVPLIRAAGSGILVEGHAKSIFQAKKDRVMGILSHEECGAAGVYAEKYTIEGDTDTIAAQAAETVAKSLDSLYVGQIKSYGRPEGLHTARAIYYDGTNRGFEPSRVSTLPQGFGISRGFFGRQAGMENAALAKTIAMGDTGFSELFTEEHPLYVVAITDQQEGSIPMAAMRQELKTVQAENVVVEAVDLSRLV